MLFQRIAVTKNIKNILKNKQEKLLKMLWKELIYIIQGKCDETNLDLKNCPSKIFFKEQIDMIATRIKTEVNVAFPIKRRNVVQYGEISKIM